MIEELYKASQAGAEIDIVSRSICALRPGVAGLSENIRVRSIVGRFLEHSRVYILEAGDKSTFLIGSADLMPRNLDDRLEIVVPVQDARARQRISAVFDALLADNAQAWHLRARRFLATSPPEEGRSSSLRADRPDADHARTGTAHGGARR